MVVGLDGRVLLEGFPSGVSQVTRELFLRLIEAAPDWQFVLFVSGQNMPALEERTTEFEGKTNVRIVRRHIPNRLLNLSLSLLGLPHLDQLVGGVDIWFAPNIGFVRVKQAKLVLLVHDTTFITYANLLQPYTRWWHRMIRPQQLLQRADVIITPSQHSRQSIRTEFPQVPEQKIQVIPFGPPTPPTLNQVDLVTVREKFNLTQPFCVTLGTLEPRKNIRTLLEGWTEDMGRLVVIGAKGWDQLPTHPQVTYLGYLTQTEKWALLRQAECLIYPTIAEGFGLPVLEAFAAHTPVIAGPHTALVEVGQDAVLWTNVHNQETLRQAVQSLLSDVTLRQHLVTQGQAVLNTCSWETSIQALKHLMQQAVPGSSGNPEQATQ